MDRNQTSAPPFDRLAERVEGDVSDDVLLRYMLSTDASIFRKMPAAVVYPKHTADVQETIRFAAAHGLSVHARGGGSGLCGSAVGEGIVVDFSRYMNRRLRLDTEQGWFECEPGYRMGELEADIAHTGLFFPPDPSSGEYATFGGMCATNASGAHSVKYGNTADYLLDAEMVFADGQVRLLSAIAETPLERLPQNLRQLAALYTAHAQAIESAYPPIRCNVAGYNLRGLVQDGRLLLHKLIAGAEGTLGVVTRLRFRLLPKPAADSLVVAFFDDIVGAARAVQQILPLGPSGIEVMDKSLLQLARESDAALRQRIPAGIDNVLLIEFDGADASACTAPATGVRNRLIADGLAAEAYLAVSEPEKQKFWALRKAAVPILYKLKGPKKVLALVEDAAVPVERLVEFFQGLYTIFPRHGVRFVLFGHIAKGLLHTRPLLDLKDPGDVGLLKVLADEVFELVHGLNGTVSGEHGDGRIRSAYIKRRFAGIYDLFRQAKHLLDPKPIFNPEIKILDDPSQMTRDLRFGAGYRAADLRTLRLNWPEGFAAEVEKCHGCSKCTTITNATRMCPVYKFSREESAAPKAKANVLRALLSGAVAAGALYEAACRRVMALCINCGSCAVECPSNVNIPKLAMEAKAQCVKRSGASVTDWLTGHVGPAARALHRLAPVINPLMGLGPLKQVTERLTGLSAQRPLALFQRRSLFARRPREIAGTGRGKVLYYAGCFAGYMRPELGEAAVEVLNRLGFTVHLPHQACCGLPMLSKGMTDGARRQVMQNRRYWRRLVDAVDAVVVTCSSCGFALINDWPYLADDAFVRHVGRKTIHLSQLILDSGKRFSTIPLPVAVAYHQPCHLRLQKDSQSSLHLLGSLPGISLHDLRSHCCGMAGSWGLAAANQTLSRTIGSQMLERLGTSGAQWAVTDCPTCEMQLAHLGRLPVRHPVEVVRRAMSAK